MSLGYLIIEEFRNYNILQLNFGLLTH